METSADAQQTTLSLSDQFNSLIEAPIDRLLLTEFISAHITSLSHSYPQWVGVVCNMPDFILLDLISDKNKQSLSMMEFVQSAFSSPRAVFALVLYIKRELYSCTDLAEFSRLMDLFVIILQNAQTVYNAIVQHVTAQEEVMDESTDETHRKSKFHPRFDWFVYYLNKYISDEPKALIGRLVGHLTDQASTSEPLLHILNNTLAINTYAEHQYYSSTPPQDTTPIEIMFPRYTDTKLFEFDGDKFTSGDFDFTSETISPHYVKYFIGVFICGDDGTGFVNITHQLRGFVKDPSTIPCLNLQRRSKQGLRGYLTSTLTESDMAPVRIAFEKMSIFCKRFLSEGSLSLYLHVGANFFRLRQFSEQLFNLPQPHFSHCCDFVPMLFDLSSVNKLTTLSDHKFNIYDDLPRDMWLIDCSKHPAKASLNIGLLSWLYSSSSKLASSSNLLHTLFLSVSIVPIPHRQYFLDSCAAPFSLKQTPQSSDTNHMESTAYLFFFIHYSYHQYLSHTVTSYQQFFSYLFTKSDPCFCYPLFLLIGPFQFFPENIVLLQKHITLVAHAGFLNPVLPPSHQIEQIAQLPSRPPAFGSDHEIPSDWSPEMTQNHKNALKARSITQLNQFLVPVRAFFYTWLATNSIVQLTLEAPCELAASNLFQHLFKIKRYACPECLHHQPIQKQFDRDTPKLSFNRVKLLPDPLYDRNDEFIASLKTIVADTEGNIHYVEKLNDAHAGTNTDSDDCEFDEGVTVFELTNPFVHPPRDEFLTHKLLPIQGSRQDTVDFEAIRQQLIEAALRDIDQNDKDNVGEYIHEIFTDEVIWDFFENEMEPDFGEYDLGQIVVETFLELTPVNKPVFNRPFPHRFQNPCFSKQIAQIKSSTNQELLRTAPCRELKKKYQQHLAERRKAEAHLLQCLLYQTLSSAVSLHTPLQFEAHKTFPFPSPIINTDDLFDSQYFHGLGVWCTEILLVCCLNIQPFLPINAINVVLPEFRQERLESIPWLPLHQLQIGQCSILPPLSFYPMSHSALNKIEGHAQDIEYWDPDRSHDFQTWFVYDDLLSTSLNTCLIVHKLAFDFCQLSEIERHALLKGSKSL